MRLSKENYPTVHILSRPDPASASASDIVEALRQILRYNWVAGCSYAHVVIDDYNMSDRDILYCLYSSPVWNGSSWGFREGERSAMRGEWVASQILHAGLTVPYELWEEEEIAVVLELDAEVTRFLRWLLRTSEEERDTASCILWEIDPFPT